MQSDSTIPPGYCQCGCGGKTNLAPRNDAAHNLAKGKPRHYIRGHHSRKLTPAYLVDDKTGCWIWQRSRNGGGYGKCHEKIDGKNISKMAHRHFFEIHHGPIPDGMQLDHLCRNRRCVNPDHLEIVTPAINTQRSSAAKLNWKKVIRLRKLRQEGMTIQALADKFGICHRSAWLICANKTWADLSYSPVKGQQPGKAK